MSAQHTPGPWRLDEVSWSRGRRLFIVRVMPDGSRRLIAHVVRQGAGNTDADARLFLASPDLLAAAEAAVAYDEAIKSAVASDGDGLDELYEAWISKSRAAIAAAKGETP